MSSRQQTPDIMAEIMGGNIAVEHESLKAIKPESIIEPKQENNSTIKHDSLKKKIAPVEVELKEKTTFNLSVTTLEKLDDTWISLRKKLKDKGRITKTLIVERAIELAIKELETKGDSSALFRDLVKR